MKYLVQINYKSGNSVKLWFSKFELIMNTNGEITELKWELTHPNTSVLFVGIKDIESIIQLDAQPLK